jgi:hypothetical protein
MAAFSTEWSGFLNVVKVASAVAAVLLSVCGVVGDTRKEGKLTHWGKITLLLIGVTSTLALLIQNIEKQKDDEKDRESALVVADNITRLKDIFLQTKHSNEALAYGNKTQQQSIDSLRNALRLLRTTAKEEEKLASKTEQINNDLKRSVTKQNALLGEQQRIGKNINRVLRPMNDIAILYEVVKRVDFEDSPYVIRLKKMADSISLMPPKHRKNFTATYGSYDNISYSFDGENKLVTISIAAEADEVYFPTQNDSESDMALNHLDLILLFSKAASPTLIRENKSKEYSVFGWNRGVQNIDLGNNLFFRGDAYPVISHGRTEFIKNNKNKYFGKFYLELDYEHGVIIQRVITNAIILDADGSTISSVLDLPDAYLAIGKPNFSPNSGNDYENIKLKKLELYFGQDFSQSLSVKVSDLQDIGRSSEPFWIYKIKQADIGTTQAF